MQPVKMTSFDKAGIFGAPSQQLEALNNINTIEHTYIVINAVINLTYNK